MFLSGISRACDAWFRNRSSGDRMCMGNCTRCRKTHGRRQTMVATWTLHFVEKITTACEITKVSCCCFVQWWSTKSPQTNWQEHQISKLAVWKMRFQDVCWMEVMTRCWHFWTHLPIADVCGTVLCWHHVCHTSSDCCDFWIIWWFELVNICFTLISSIWIFVPPAEIKVEAGAIVCPLQVVTCIQNELSDKIWWRSLVMGVKMWIFISSFVVAKCVSQQCAFVVLDNHDKPTLCKTNSVDVTFQTAPHFHLIEWAQCFVDVSGHTELRTTEESIKDSSCGVCHIWRSPIPCTGKRELFLTMAPRRKKKHQLAIHLIAFIHVGNFTGMGANIVELSNTLWNGVWMSLLGWCKFQADATKSRQKMCAEACLSNFHRWPIKLFWWSVCKKIQLILDGQWGLLVLWWFFPMQEQMRLTDWQKCAAQHFFERLFGCKNVPCLPRKDEGHTNVPSREVQKWNWCGWIILNPMAESVWADVQKNENWISSCHFAKSFQNEFEWIDRHSVWKAPKLKKVKLSTSNTLTRSDQHQPKNAARSQCCFRQMNSVTAHATVHFAIHKMTLLHEFRQHLAFHCCCTFVMPMSFGQPLPTLLQMPLSGLASNKNWMPLDVSLGKWRTTLILSTLSISMSLSPLVASLLKSLKKLKIFAHVFLLEPVVTLQASFTALSSLTWFIAIMPSPLVKLTSFIKLSFSFIGLQLVAKTLKNLNLTSVRLWCLHLWEIWIPQETDQDAHHHLKTLSNPCVFSFSPPCWNSALICLSSCCAQPEGHWTSFIHSQCRQFLSWCQPTANRVNHKAEDLKAGLFPGWFSKHPGNHVCSLPLGGRAFLKFPSWNSTVWVPSCPVHFNLGFQPQVHKLSEWWLVTPGDHLTVTHDLIALMKWKQKPPQLALHDRLSWSFWKHLTCLLSFMAATRHSFESNACQVSSTIFFSKSVHHSSRHPGHQQQQANASLHQFALWCSKFTDGVFSRIESDIFLNVVVVKSSLLGLELSWLFALSLSVAMVLFSSSMVFMQSTLVASPVLVTMVWTMMFNALSALTQSCCHSRWKSFPLHCCCWGWWEPLHVLASSHFQEEPVVGTHSCSSFDAVISAIRNKKLLKIWKLWGTQHFLLVHWQKVTHFGSHPKKHLWPKIQQLLPPWKQFTCHGTKTHVHSSCDAAILQVFQFHWPPHSLGLGTLLPWHSFLREKINTAAKMPGNTCQNWWNALSEMTSCSWVVLQTLLRESQKSFSTVHSQAKKLFPHVILHSNKRTHQEQPVTSLDKLCWLSKRCKTTPKKKSLCRSTRTKNVRSGNCDLLQSLTKVDLQQKTVVNVTLPLWCYYLCVFGVEIWGSLQGQAWKKGCHPGSCGPDGKKKFFQMVCASHEKWARPRWAAGQEFDPA